MKRITMLAVAMFAVGCNCGGRVRGISGDLVIEPKLLDFGDVFFTQTKTLPVTLTNRSGAAIDLTDVFVMEDENSTFTYGDWPTQLASGASVELSVTYTARLIEGVDEAQLHVLSDALPTGEALVDLRARSLSSCTKMGCFERVNACGILDDGCGGTVDCGPCECVPTTCAAQGKTCGDIMDGCGSQLSCGSACTSCVAKTCADLGTNCGSVADGCGGSVECGACQGTQVCGGGGVVNVCGVPATGGTCGVVAAPPTGPLLSTCKLQFPPAQGISACTISETGTKYYVDAASGSDSNNGTSPGQAWASLCKATTGAPAGSTVLVAEGVYLSADVQVRTPITIKGGWNSTFTDWNPDTHPSTFAGQLTMSHDGAVFGGFQMRSRPVGTGGRWHEIAAGTLVRNYIEIVTTAGGTQNTHVYNINAGAQGNPGANIKLLCNDVYARVGGTSPRIAVYGIYVYNQGGSLVMDSNRMCVDKSVNPWVNEVVEGMGSCLMGQNGNVRISNNVMESAQIQTSILTNPSYGVELYGCRSDLDVALVNNTIVSGGFAVHGYSGGQGGVVKWTLVNNLMWQPSGWGQPVNLTGMASPLLRAEGNLAFGFQNNTFSPQGVVSMGNDLANTAQAGLVFKNPNGGDFRLANTSPAIGTAVNVYNMSTYGSLTKDLAGIARPQTGAWDRGAFQH